MLDPNDLTNRLLAAEESKAVTIADTGASEQDEAASKSFLLLID